MKILLYKHSYPKYFHLFTFMHSLYYSLSIHEPEITNDEKTNKNIGLRKFILKYLVSYCKLPLIRTV